MRAVPRQVLSPAKPVVGQSLIGLVRECAWFNRLPSVGVLLKDSIGTNHAWSNLSLRDDLSEKSLATSMGIAGLDVCSRMYPARRVAPDVVVRSFFGAEVRSYDLDCGTRSFATGALETNGHHRAIWQFGLLPFCWDTGEMLVDRCLRCENRLEWGAAKPLNRCSQCNRPATADRQQVPNDLIAASRLLFGSLDPRPIERAEATAKLHQDLATLPAGAAADLGWSLGRLVCNAPIGKRARDRFLPSATKAEIILAGADILAGWPDSVPTLLRQALVRDQALARRLQAGLKILAGERAGWPEQRILLAARHLELVGKARQAFGDAHGNTLEAAAAVPLLRINPAHLPKLVEVGGLDAVGAKRDQYLSAIFDADSVDRIAALRQDCLPFGHASERLGISHDGIDQLIDAALLKEHVGTSIQVMYKRRQVSKGSFQLLVKGLELAAKRRGIKKTGVVPDISLSRASCGIGGGTKPWAEIFRALLQRDLPFFLVGDDSVKGSAGTRKKSVSLADRVFVQPADFTRLQLRAVAERIIEKKHHTAGISRRDAEEVLNLTPANLLKAIEGELKSALLPNGRLLRSEVISLAKIRIAPAEMSMRFASGSLRLPNELHNAGVEKLGVTGWSRRAVETVLTTDMQDD